jgi:hypothetical protein
MKINVKTITIATAIFILPTISIAQQFNTGIEYLSFIGEQYKQLSDDQWNYTKSVANDKSAKKIESKRLELLKTNKSAQLKISKMPDFKSNTSYRDSVVQFLKLNYNVLNNDYEKIVNMEEIAEQSYDLMEAYLTAQELAGEKIKEASKMLTTEEKKFASENNINLVDNQSKKSSKLEEAAKVYKYYNKIYLIFFKSYKQEAYLLDAMSKLDLNAMEQNKNALLEYAEEGLKELNELKAYESDNSLLVAAKEMLAFYKDEASKKMPIILDFYLKKEKYESIQKAFDEKKKSKRTNEDINSINKASEEYNEAVNKYNEINEFLNKNRTKQLDNWNSSSKKFTKKHI